MALTALKYKKFYTQKPVSHRLIFWTKYRLHKNENYFSQILFYNIFIIDFINCFSQTHQSISPILRFFQCKIKMACWNLYKYILFKKT